MGVPDFSISPKSIVSQMFRSDKGMFITSHPVLAQNVNYSTQLNVFKGPLIILAWCVIGSFFELATAKSDFWMRDYVNQA